MFCQSMDSDRSCKALAIIYLLALVFLFDVNVVEIGIQCYALEEEQCTSDLSPFLPLPYSDTSQMACKNIWNSFFIRYSQTDDNTVTIILSTIYTTGWVGIGFSKDGMMLNSSCMVGWVSMQGAHARIKQYHIEGFTPSEIIPDQGEIPLTNVPPFVVLNRATLYLAFQLKYPYRLKEQSILLAFGSKHPHPKHHLLTLHDDKTSIKFDFSSGKLASVSASPRHYSQRSMKKTHGVLALLAWGIFIPYGAIIARYLRRREPLWYYLHVTFQFIGFILGLTVVVVGLSLDRTLHAVPAHKGIGIFVFVLSILQVMAFFLRPNKDSKKRKLWNLYHHCVGRIAIIFAAVNIIVGVHYGGSETAWKIGSGFVLGSNFLASFVLEILLRLKRLHDADLPPELQMDNVSK